MALLAVHALQRVGEGGEDGGDAFAGLGDGLEQSLGQLPGALLDGLGPGDRVVVRWAKNCVSKTYKRKL